MRGRFLLTNTDWQSFFESNWIYQENNTTKSNHSLRQCKEVHVLPISVHSNENKIKMQLITQAIGRTYKH